MTRVNELLRIRELLQRRRREILTVSLGTHRELDALKQQEKDPEYEEGAQSELADYTLSSLVEAQRREIMLIDAALRRMDENVFGECVDCGTEIPMERLEAMPFAIRCEEDATSHELETRGGRMATSSL
ncbi:transcriptional regulator, TraR/DksA family [Stigmatella aurantiaca]|uniref:Transcriptional regulator, TraR/DksA family n=1 Tax=Stigmatella aurantiaca TaxID=41 RepID=A0A1H8D6N8_STIAU|nr:MULTISPECIES: TraR/DksA C4-type zinc finger protein [Stigmatella]SEN02157.1 transcriptional regulator, TraR/DksA family [Stigmatella aurantiaca]